MIREGWLWDSVLAAAGEATSPGGNTWQLTLDLFHGGDI